MSQPPYPPPPDPYAPQPLEAYNVPPPVSTGMATTALVLGIIAIPTTLMCVGPLLGIIAVVLGIIAIARAAGAPDRFGGKGRAVAGVLTGA